MEIVCYNVNSVIKTFLIGGNNDDQISDGTQRENPKTGAAITIPACKVPAFKAGKGLKDAVAE